MANDEQTPINFESLKEAWAWQPIRNCPGRYRLSDAPTDLPLEAILGPAFKIREFRVVAAKDIVLVARFQDGGMISYKRENGSFLHTLNTAEGFARKLAQLGIELPIVD